MCIINLQIEKSKEFIAFDLTVFATYVNKHMAQTLFTSHKMSFLLVLWLKK